VRSREDIRQKMVESTLQHASLWTTEVDIAYTMGYTEWDSSPLICDGAMQRPIILSPNVLGPSYLAPGSAYTDRRRH
jgi:hypothetical protein